MSDRRTSCRQVRRRIALVAAGQGSPSDLNVVRSHIARCDRCRAYDHDLRELSADLRAWEQSTPEVRLSDAASARWEQAVYERARGRRRVWIPFAAWPEVLGGRPAGWVALIAVWVVAGLLRLSAPAIRENPATSPPPSLTQMRLVFGNTDYPDRTGEIVPAVTPAPPRTTRPTGAIPPDERGAAASGEHARAWVEDRGQYRTGFFRADTWGST